MRPQLPAVMTQAQAGRGQFHLGFYFLGRRRTHKSFSISILQQTAGSTKQASWTQGGNGHMRISQSPACQMGSLDPEEKGGARRERAWGRLRSRTGGKRGQAPRDTWPLVPLACMAPGPCDPSTTHFCSGKHICFSFQTFKCGGVFVLFF